ARFTLNPSSPWSLSASYAFLKSPEALEPSISQQRVTTSVLNTRPVWKTGEWASAVIYGVNKLEHTDRWSNSLLAESNLSFDRSNSVFARLEYVDKSAEDLDLSDQPPDARFSVGSVAFGYVRELVRYPGGTLGLGGRLAIDFVPAAIAPDYGSRTPTGFAVYLRIRPRRLPQTAMAAMDMPTGRAVQRP
ncbi:MAG: hypothetical protein ACREND_17480, partial [Gemmatimonadaceae bacterium]